MTRRPEISGAVGEGEAPAAPEATCGVTANWGSIKRHRRAGQPNCDACRKFARDYSREWYRTALAMPAFRERHNAVVAEGQRRRRSTAEGRAAYNAKVRQRDRARRERDRVDRLHAVDNVVVRRLVAGETANANRAERLEAVRQLRDRGASYAQIATLLHADPRQIHRDLADLGLINSTGAVA